MNGGRGPLKPGGTFAQPLPSKVLDPVVVPKAPAPPVSTPMPSQPTEIVTVSGGTNTVNGSGNTSLARYVGQIERTMAIYSSATSATGNGGDQSDLWAHQTMMRISWGTLKGGTQRVMEVPCGKRVVLTGSTFDVQGFMRRYDGQPTIPTLHSTVQCFIAPNVDALAPATWWQMPPLPQSGAEPRLFQGYTGLMWPAPVTVHEVHGRNVGATDETILLYDVPVDVDDVKFSAHNDPILDQLGAPAGSNFFIDYGDEGQQFFNGLLWVASSSPTVVTIDTGATVFLKARLGVQ